MSQESSHPRQLKNIFINPRFQLKVMSYFFVLFLITTASLYSTTFLFFWRFKQKALTVGIPEGHVFFEFLQNQKQEMDSLFVGLAVVNLFILILTSIILTHRIAGPLSKLKSYLLRTESKETFKLRQNDFFKEDLETVAKAMKDKSS